MNKRENIALSSSPPLQFLVWHLLCYNFIDWTSLSVKWESEEELATKWWDRRGGKQFSFSCIWYSFFSCSYLGSCLVLFFSDCLSTSSTSSYAKAVYPLLYCSPPRPHFFPCIILSVTFVLYSWLSYCFVFFFSLFHGIFLCSIFVWSFTRHPSPFPILVTIFWSEKPTKENDDASLDNLLFKDWRKSLEKSLKTASTKPRERPGESGCREGGQDEEEGAWDSHRRSHFSIFHLLWGCVCSILLYNLAFHNKSA